MIKQVAKCFVVFCLLLTDVFDLSTFPCPPETLASIFGHKPKIGFEYGIIQKTKP